MKNMNLTPQATHHIIQELTHTTTQATSDEWKATGLKVRPDTWKRAKRYAADHEMKLQNLVDEAFRYYLNQTN
ncbi:hypothetical protein [Bifidobacterium boum]|uniref:Protein L-Myc-1b n=1 Tax=Bifidobacterium boum TaxID=78343 RepID=A0A086ZKI4_9BIFI|nr:hypothetical protein [Bifidobacterium boum]KFI47034.1 protein L-Myc-1b [Bifidobacterium boum]